MILTSQYNITLKKKNYDKILHLFPCNNQNFVFLGMSSPRNDCLVHCDKQGNILHELKFQKPMDSMGMLSNNEVILLETRNNKITFLNLETYELKSNPHQFMYEESDQSDIFTFLDTKYLCIEEKGRYNQNRYKLSYYQYPFHHGYNKPKVVYQAQVSDWTYEYLTRKANNHSMICWFKPRHDDSFDVRVYEILQKQKGALRIYKYQQSISSRQVGIKVQTAVHNVWELKKGQLLFRCFANRIDKKKGKGTVINDNYIVQTINQGIIRQAKFTFGPFQDYIVDVYNLGPYSMWRSFSIEDGKSIPSPTYYIDHQTQKIVAQQSAICNYLNKYQFPGYCEGLICEGLYQNSNISNFKVYLKRYVKLSQVYLHMMLESYSQFDEQFLELALQCLDLS